MNSLEQQKAAILEQHYRCKCRHVVGCLNRWHEEFAKVDDIQDMRRSPLKDEGHKFEFLQCMLPSGHRGPHVTEWFSTTLIWEQAGFEKDNPDKAYYFYGKVDD